MTKRPSATRWVRALMVMAIATFSVLTAAANAADRPNILWITAEDMSPTLGCYGDKFAITPHIDRLREQSVKYTNAFATAPVCSPSRSCLINGVYAQSQGTHNMRSAFPLPDYMTGFPSFLRKVGYYTSNNVKTDYNSANWDKIIKASWDESSADAHWRKRQGDEQAKPFFSVFNLMTSHQSRTMVWPHEKFQQDVQSMLSPAEVHSPKDVPLPPYYVDTPVVRKTVARYYDCVTAMDKQVGDILDQLERDGLADDTIVFFYSDHGSGMPRHKRALLDSGMHVPLLVRFPAKWRHLAGDVPHKGEPGSVTDRLVSFVDFGPTVLSIANVDIPEWMQGKPFLGPKTTKQRDYVYGHRDRVDEVIDMARSVRDKRYLYIRNFMPHLSYNQPTVWPDLGEIRHEFYRLADRDKMTKAQWHFAGPTKPVEELYDCEKDPMNLHNLVGSPDHDEVLLRMRGQLWKHLRSTPDLGFIPEALQWQLVDAKKATPRELGLSLKPFNQSTAIEAASWVGMGDEDTLVTNVIRGREAVVRYWAAVAINARTKLTEDMIALLKKATADKDVSVRTEAASALCRHGHVDAGLPVLIKSLEHDNLAAVLYAARAIELLGDKAKGAVDAMRKLDARMKGMRPKDMPATVVQPGDLDMAMFIGFSTKAFLDKVAGGVKTSADDGAGWIDLLAGDAASNWVKRTKSGVTDKAEATIADGEVKLMAKGTNLWFTHDSVWKDFELEVEGLMPDGGYNSGVGFRCVVEPKFSGYQCEVADEKSGMIYAIGKGWVYPKTGDDKKKFAADSKGAFRKGEWNRFRVRCEGNHVQVWVNDVLTADVRDDKFTEGRIAVQHHGKGDVHRFRNIRVRALKVPE